MEPSHTHEAHNADLYAAISEAAFDERYRSRESLWSGNPNPQLVSEVQDLPPGYSLDVGCGEGADAIWLAERAWRVTAVDFSQVALERARTRASSLGAEVSERIEWLHHDLTQWEPAERSFDLVSAQFMHVPKEQRDPLFRRLARAVALGGFLLLVGHDRSDMQVTNRRPHPELYFTGDEVVADALPPGDWDIQVNESRARTVTNAEGHAMTIHDVVVLARRHAE